MAKLVELHYELLFPCIPYIWFPLIPSLFQCEKMIRWKRLVSNEETITEANAHLIYLFEFFGSVDKVRILLDKICQAKRKLC